MAGRLGVTQQAVALLENVMKCSKFTWGSRYLVVVYIGILFDVTEALHLPADLFFRFSLIGVK